MQIELGNIDESYLEMTYKWLNDKEIKALTNTPSFSREDQIEWFNSIYKRIDYQIWGIIVDNYCIGVCGLKNITEFDCEYWGYIGEKKYWGRGIGSFIIKTLIDLAKSQNKASVWLTVTKANKIAINLYTKFGFKTEHSEDDHLMKMRLIF